MLRSMRHESTFIGQLKLRMMELTKLWVPTTRTMKPLLDQPNGIIDQDLDLSIPNVMTEPMAPHPGLGQSECLDALPESGQADSQVAYAPTQHLKV